MVMCSTFAVAVHYLPPPVDPLPFRALDSNGVSIMRKLIWFLVLAAAFSGLAFGDDEHHHDDVSFDQLGTVHFPVSCTPEAQKTFEKGVALQHSFWYEAVSYTHLASSCGPPRGNAGCDCEFSSAGTLAEH